ncbi:MAG: ABC transporter permease [Acidibacillus sp.]|uniref:Dipeptide transport system permease protein DppB n=1 Tax=Sulfoacidibacillus ferrooxidans TaxID=2005001 RepID=A0A9X2ADQ6_9BACL|nr:Dipeptide transport system permease protein DppB [Sulfoacidibacillus ferrooxidans]MCY0894620.1 ABC transporter permease [Acidibacillus sp.]
MKYFLHRVGFLFLSMFAAVTLNFLLPRMMPGNPATVLFAKFQGRMTPQALHALEAEFGFNHKPLIDQYFSYLGGLVTGHWGLSFNYYPTPVTSVIASSLPWTIGLVGISTIISVFMGTIIGIYIAWRRKGILDSVLPTSLMFFQAMPTFWVALMLLYIFGFLLSWFPMSHAYSNSIVPGMSGSYLLSILYHAVLPGFTIFIGSLSGWMIGMRNNMINTLGEDYIVFAEAKGISPARLMFSYTARNAILPQITSFAIALGNVVSGSILVEMVFSYPGIGYQLVNAVTGEDYPLIQGTFLIIALSVLIANFIVDLLLSRLDPRVRREGAVA